MHECPSGQCRSGKGGKESEKEISQDTDWKSRAGQGGVKHKELISRRIKERASLAGASGRLWLFNALINPLLKAMQRVSGFVRWACDYSAINKG